MDSPSDNSFYEDHIEETDQPAVKDSAAGEAESPGVHAKLREKREVTD